MNRVLIVDDKEENLYYLQSLLKGNGCEVESAENGAEALEKARVSPPDMVVSDLLMPVMDGYALLRQWKADPRLKEVPFVVYTATYTDPADEQLALDLGADAFILKAAEPEHFMERVRGVWGMLRAGGGVAEPRMPIEDEGALLKGYSEALIRKLEEKTLMLQEQAKLLEESNQALARDVERSRQMEASLAAAQQVAKVGSWETDLTTGDLACSAQMHRILGTEAGTDRPTWESFLDRIHPDDQKLMENAFRESCESEGARELTHRIVAEDGQVKHVVERWKVFRNAEGRPYRALGTCRDITERIESEGRLRHLSSLLHAVAEGTTDAVFVKDREGRYLFVNAATAKFFGRSKEEVIGRDDSEFFGVEEARLLRVADRQVMDSGEARTSEERLTLEGTRRVFSAIKAPYRDQSGRIVGTIGISRDITDQKNLEAQFLRAQRMESIGTLAGGIAHDLNNVLAPILMSIELLKMDESAPDKLEILATIESSARRGGEMVRQVLSFARGVEGQKVPLSVKPILKDIEKVANDTFLKSIDLRCEIEPELWMVEGDPTQLHQVLLNLAVNARDAMPQGGLLRLSARNEVLDEHYAAMNLEASAGPYVVLEVEDSGYGMPPEVVDRVFEPFFTTKETGKGTGLGLSTSLAIVRGHGGFVRVYSEPRNGTRFRVYLPALVADAREVVEQQRVELPRGQGETVLLVEDELAVREIARQTLESYGYEVLAASDGAEATAVFAMERERIDVVLTDMMMPNMDGPAAIQVMKRIDPEVRIVATSGLGEGGMIGKAASLGVKHFLSKPYTADALLRTLREIFGPGGE